MEFLQLGNLAILRAVVGCLGERAQFGWWQSSFFDPNSGAFLTPVFARTPVLARCEGVTRAAALVHDERIGKGRVYHLFRLPEEMEQGIHRALYDAGVCGQVMSRTTQQTEALAWLRGQAASPPESAIGPALIGEAQALRTATSWSVVAAHYLHAFEAGIQIFPYFLDKP